MKKYTLKELKNLVSLGAAINITNAAYPCIDEQYDKIGYSTGIYGINGGLLKGKSGQLYVITCRNSNLFRYF